MKEILLALFLASQSYGVSYELLYAIAKAESNLNPHAVSVNRNGSVDIGLMQINSYWVRKYNLKEEWLFDPFYNAMWGAYILRLCMNKFGNSWKAIDCYNKGQAKAKNWSSYTFKVCKILYGGEKCKGF